MIIYMNNIIRSSVLPRISKPKRCNLQQILKYGSKLSDEEKAKELERIAREASLDEPPTSCCRSACANCVYIAWAEALMAKMQDAAPDIVTKIMNKVEDPSMKAYLELELRIRARGSPSNKNRPNATPKKSATTKANTDRKNNGPKNQKGKGSPSSKSKPNQSDTNSDLADGNKHSTYYPKGSTSVNMTPGDKLRSKYGDKSSRLSDESLDNHDGLTSLRMEMRLLFGTLQSTIMTRVDNLENQVSEIKSMTSSVQTTNSDIGKSVDLVSEKLSAMETKIEEKRYAMQNQIAQIDSRCENMDRYLRKTCIEVRNVPKTTQEKTSDLYSSVISLTRSLEVKLDIQDIRDAYRIYRKGSENPTIVVELGNTLIKANILEAVKKWSKSGRKQLSTKHMGLDCPQAPIYVSEYLTAKGKRLYYLAREFAKTFGYQCCWTNDGLVYLRKKHGEPNVLIKSEEQFDELKIAK